MSDIRSYNIGKSDYSKHKLQPWDIWIEYALNPFDADIIKRVLRKKEESGMTKRESRKLDYKKIIHICEERLRQLDENTDPWDEFFENIEGQEPKEDEEHFLEVGKKYRCIKTYRAGSGYEVFTIGKPYAAETSNCLHDNCGCSYITKELFEEHFEH